MTLPDWTTALNTQFGNWLGWSTLELLMTALLGSVVIFIIARKLLSIFF